MIGARARRDDRGAAAVEFALVVPVLLALVFGMIDFGYALNRYAMVNNATREGVRAASLGDSEAEVRAAVQDYLGDMSGGATIALSCETPAGTGCASWSAQESGGVAVVTVAYDHSWITPVGTLISSGVDLTKTSRMRIE